MTPDVRVLKQIIYECTMYTFVSLSLYLAGSQQHHLFFTLLNPSPVSRFYIHLPIYSSNHFLLGTSYLPGTLLVAEDTIMNKADNGPGFMEINGDEG